MNIVLSFNNMAEVLTLPFIPPDLSIPFNPRKNEEFDIIGGMNNVGTLNLPGLRGLRTLTIESFFATKYYPFAKVQKNGWECVNLINKWANSRMPIRVIITDKDFEIINMACLIENFTYGLDKAGDIPYILELKEFVFPVVK